MPNVSFVEGTTPMHYCQPSAHRANARSRRPQTHNRGFTVDETRRKFCHEKANFWSPLRKILSVRKFRPRFSEGYESKNRGKTITDEQ